MDTMQAFSNGEKSRDRELMVFDWDKAATIIKDRGVTDAVAGLSGDFEGTGGDILSDGIIVDADKTYTYLSSTWANPQLLIDGEYIDCYKIQSETDKWGGDTYWPESSVEIFNKK